MITSCRKKLLGDKMINTFGTKTTCFYWNVTFVKPKRKKKTERQDCQLAEEKSIASQLLYLKGIKKCK